MSVIIKENYDLMSDWVATYVVYRINRFKPTNEKPFVLGLPTGSTPLGLYKRLIEYYHERKISFENIVTFNMDEYVGLKPEHDQSYHYFMWENFFKHINIKKENVNILDGCAIDLNQQMKNHLY